MACLVWVHQGVPWLQSRHILDEPPKRRHPRGAAHQQHLADGLPPLGPQLWSQPFARPLPKALIATPRFVSCQRCPQINARLQQSQWMICVVEQGAGWRSDQSTALDGGCQCKDDLSAFVVRLPLGSGLH